jgi:hypothetical protein
MYRILGISSLAILGVSSAVAQQQAQPSSHGGSQQSLSSSLGVYVFPAKHQTPEQQNADESSCFSWAKEQTGIDPMAPTSQTASSESQQQQKDPTKGSGAKGAAKGAAGGAAIGAIADDAGTGAAIGATAGAVRGRRQAKKAKKEAEKEQQQAQVSAQQQQKDTYNKAFSACMEGKGYTAK